VLRKNPQCRDLFGLPDLEEVSLMSTAIEASGEATVAEAVRSALEAFTGSDGRVHLPAWYRAVLAHA
jgi:hypothetical protein